MISQCFDFSEFINEIKDQDKHMILIYAESELREAEKNAEIKGHGHDYVEMIHGFIYFLRHFQKPYGTNDKNFQMSRIVIKKLVAKKQVPSDLLKFFD